MLTFTRRAIGVVLMLQFGAMLAFDLWLWTGDLDLDKLPFNEAAMFVGVVVFEVAVCAFGLWLVWYKPNQTAAEPTIKPS